MDTQAFYSQDYLSLVFNSAFNVGNPEALLCLLLLSLGRILPIIGMSPFFGAKVLPNPVKVTFGLSLFIVFFPQLIQVTTTPLTFSPILIMLMFKEIFVGYIIGYIMSIPFAIVGNTGMMIDHQRGGASLMVNDPLIQNQSSPLGTLFNLVLVYLFCAFDGPFYFIDAILSSYSAVPPDKLINPTFFQQDNPFWKGQIALLNTIMVISIQLAAPALIAILMTDFFLGIANRLAPQVQITFLGMPLKSLLGLAVVCMGWKLYNKETIKQAMIWLDHVKDTIKILSQSAIPQ
jgi:type III secretion protein T